MSNIEKRIERIEERCGIDKDDQAVEIPLGRGVWRTTKAGVANVLQWLRERNGASGGACRELTGETR